MPRPDHNPPQRNIQAGLRPHQSHRRYYSTPPPIRHCPLPDTDHFIQDYAFYASKKKKITFCIQQIYIYSYPFYFIYFCNFLNSVNRGKCFSKNPFPNPCNNFIYYKVKKFGVFLFFFGRKIRSSTPSSITCP